MMASEATRGPVGVVGAGMIGSAIIERLVPDGPVLVWDPSPAARDRAVAAGASAVAQLSELVTASVVLLALPGPDQVRAVVTELLAGRDDHGDPDRSGLAVLVDLSTVDPTTTRDLAEQASAVGVGHLDAPILGRPHRCGQWTLPVGGSAESLAVAEPVLARLASRIVPVGESGQGNVVKLLNNLMFGAINAITVETMAAAERLGLDPGVYATTLAESGAASVSGLFTELAPKIISGDVSPTFSIDLLAKDNRLALAMIEPTGLRLELAETVVALNHAAQAAGLGALDTSAMIQTVRGTAVAPSTDPGTDSAAARGTTVTTTDGVRDAPTLRPGAIPTEG